jgi:DNA processing protein
MRGWWWVWSQCPGVGAVRLSDLRALAGDRGIGPEALWTWSESRLAEALLWPRSVLRAVERYRCQLGRSPDLTVPGEVLLPCDDAWPGLLDRIAQPPKLLFRRGRLDLLDCLASRQAVAVVGTRSASPHGIRMAEELGHALARSGWPVISGLAEGIDAAVHGACLQADGAPVAVLGTGLDRVYPRHHDALQMAVSQQGLLISERSSQEPVQRGHFAHRNRLIVALASALVVVECPERSGALISARLADQCSCPVWVVPGDALRWSARGSNALLQNQAAPLLSADALVRHLGPGPLLPHEPQQASSPLNPERVEQLQLLQAMASGASLEDLSTRMRQSPAALARQLLEMERLGSVVCESGYLWRPCRR